MNYHSKKTSFLFSPVWSLTVLARHAEGSISWNRFTGLLCAYINNINKRLFLTSVSANIFASLTATLVWQNLKTASRALQLAWPTQSASHYNLSACLIICTDSSRQQGLGIKPATLQSLDCAASKMPSNQLINTLVQYRKQFWVPFLARGYFHELTAWLGYQTNNLPTAGLCSLKNVHVYITCFEDKVRNLLWKAGVWKLSQWTAAALRVRQRPL